MADLVRATLKKLITERGDTYASISALLGRNPAYIQQFITRGTPRKLDEDDRRVLSRYFGVEEATLSTLYSAADFSIPPRRQGAPAVVTVPRLLLGASAGAGSLDEDERATGLLAFDADWLRDLGVKPHRVSIIHVDGESMAPTLNHGDEIMVSHDDEADQLRDGIYALRLDEVLMVKRVAVGPRRGRFSLLSDNPHYPDWTDVDPALIVIVGRVVWTGSAVR